MHRTLFAGAWWTPFKLQESRSRVGGGGLDNSRDRSPRSIQTISAPTKTLRQSVLRFRSESDFDAIRFRFDPISIRVRFRFDPISIRSDFDFDPISIRLRTLDPPSISFLSELRSVSIRCQFAAKTSRGVLGNLRDLFLRTPPSSAGAGVLGAPYRPPTQER